MSQRLADNLASVRRRISEAADRTGRSASEIALVAVTKYASAETARQLAELGCTDLGESRPQELWAKAEALPHRDVRWHLIGHLQRNKAQHTAPLVSLVHSGDSLRILEALDASAASFGRRLSVLLEVNVSGEEAKHGFRPDEIEPNLSAIAALDNLNVRGLMCMAGLDVDLATARRQFAGLRELREWLRTVAPPTIGLEELSMGMSGDFEVAIEEGATMVRIGSALFEGLESADA